MLDHIETWDIEKCNMRQRMRRRRKTYKLRVNYIYMVQLVNTNLCTEKILIIIGCKNLSTNIKTFDNCDNFKRVPLQPILGELIYVRYLINVCYIKFKQHISKT